MATSRIEPEPDQWRAGRNVTRSGDGQDPLAARKAAARRTAIILGVIAFTIFVLSILERVLH